MLKVKYTKTELKRQRDNLRIFERYLPILQLKKQHLQFEIQRTDEVLGLKLQEIELFKEVTDKWISLLSEDRGYLKRWITPSSIKRGILNIAGINLPIFEGISFEEPSYDLFSTPLWVDRAIRIIRDFVTLLEEAEILKERLEILRQELRITNQRVNLFEKIKIPQTKESIRIIRIYLGEQETQAVGRSKIAKRKLEAMTSL